MKFEEEFGQSLMNIEVALATSYRDVEMHDNHALNGIRGLIRTYQAINRGRPQPTLKLSPLAQNAFERMKRICDVMVGSAAQNTLHEIDHHYFLQVTGNPLEDDDVDVVTLPHDQIIQCLKRVEKSVKTLHKRGGRRGYYNFVSEFLPLGNPLE